ncbi:hypothetical protein V6Z12_D08G111400 [Gossypium hirsutum]
MEGLLQAGSSYFYYKVPWSTGGILSLHIFVVSALYLVCRGDWRLYRVIYFAVSLHYS